MTTATQTPDAHLPSTQSEASASKAESNPSANTKVAAKPAGVPRRTKVIAGSVAAVIAILGLSYYVYSRGYEDTDDAQIDGNISSISPRVSATVRSVEVRENQSVKAGDVLVELDPADLDVAVLQAKAQVAQAEAELDAEDPNVPILETSNRASESTAGIGRPGQPCQSGRRSGGHSAIHRPAHSS